MADDDDTHETMPPFDTPVPHTYNELLNMLDDPCLLFEVAGPDHERFEQAAVCIAELKASNSSATPHDSDEDATNIATYLMDFIGELEALGVRGWVESLKENRQHRNYEEVELAYTVTCGHAQGLRDEVDQLEKKIEEDEQLLGKRGEEDKQLLAKRKVEDEKVLRARSRGRAGERSDEDEKGDTQQGGGIDEMKEMRGRIAKLEMQFAKLGQSCLIEAETATEYALRRHSAVSAKENDRENADASTQNNDVDYFNGPHGSHNQHSLKPITPQMKTQRLRTGSESSTTVEIGTFGQYDWTDDVAATGNTETPYPPHLDGKTFDGKKAAMLHDFEHAMWYQEQRDNNIRQEFAQRRPPSCAPPPKEQPPSVTKNETMIPDFYIFVPLPANFVIPQQNIPSLTFPSPASVFHFPEGANRDQLFAVLHKRCAEGLSSPNLEPIQDLNVIRVRTHDMERELKNAIRKIMTQKEWDSAVGIMWSSEGQGDTYIVSKPDIRFFGDSDSPRSEGDGDAEEADENLEKEDDEANRNTSTHLRGGAGLPSSDDCLCQTHDHDDTSSATDNHHPFDFQNCIEVTDGISVDVDEKSFYGSAWMEYARILELQNTAQVLAIGRLHEIIKDMEETLEWQDEQLTLMQHNFNEWKREMEQAEAKVTITKAEAEAAAKVTVSGRTQMVQLQSIVEGDGSISDEIEIHLDESGEKISAMRAYLHPDKVPGSRGGADTQQQASSETMSETDSLYAEPDTGDIKATAFYFFPRVSIIVLLDKPVHKYQWPSGTSLQQIYENLQDRHTRGIEDNPILRHIREIFEIREEMGILLPDTSHGNQVTISVPEILPRDPHENAGKNSNWEKSFGPDEYERLLREGLQFVDPAKNGNWKHSSPSDSTTSERSDDMGDLVNLVAKVESFASGERFNDEHAYLDQDPDQLSLHQTCASCTPAIEASHNLNEDTSFSPTLDSSSPTPTTIFTPTSSSPTRCLRPSLPQKGISTSEARKALMTPHPACMPKFKTIYWKVAHSPWENEHLQDELSRSTNFEYECGETFAKASDEAKEQDQWEKFRHPKGQGCESWLPWQKLDDSRTACSFCGLSFAETEGGDQKSPTDSGADTPVTRTERNSPKQSDEDSDEDGQQSRGRKTKSTARVHSSVFDTCLRGGAATRAEADQWATKCTRNDSLGPSNRPSTPHYDVENRAWHHDLDSSSLPNADTRPVSSCFSSFKGKEPAPITTAAHAAELPRPFSRAEDIAPPNSPTRLPFSTLAVNFQSRSYPSEREHLLGRANGYDRYATAVRLYNAYALREKMFMRTIDLDAMRNGKVASTFTIKTPHTRMEKRRRKTHNEYAKRMFRRFMCGKSGGDAVAKGFKASPPPTYSDEELEEVNVEENATGSGALKMDRGDDSERFEGLWMPETVAEPSKVGRSNEGMAKEEYAGMAWETY